MDSASEYNWFIQRKRGRWERRADEGLLGCWNPQKAPNLVDVANAKSISCVFAMGCRNATHAASTNFRVMIFSVSNAPVLAMRVLLFLFMAVIARPQSQDETPKQTFQRVCIDCHGMEMVEGKHYSRDLWEETVEQMVRRGAQASDEDVQTIIDYLAANYAPTKIQINRESASELQLDLPLTSKAASAIVHYRQEHGDFKSLSDLAKVPELDPAIVKENKDRFVF